MKKFCIALMAILMLFLTACGESKEEYIEKCQDPQTFEEYDANPDAYIGKPYRIEGMVLKAVEVENEELYKKDYKLYTFGLAGSEQSKGRSFIVECYVPEDEGLYEGDKVVVYGNFVGMDDDRNALLRIKIDGQYLEYIEKAPRV